MILHLGSDSSGEKETRRAVLLHAYIIGQKTFYITVELICARAAYTNKESPILFITNLEVSCLVIAQMICSFVAHCIARALFESSWTNKQASKNSSLQSA